MREIICASNQSSIPASFSSIFPNCHCRNGIWETHKGCGEAEQAVTSRRDSLLQKVISAEAPPGNSHNGGATDLKRMGEQTLPEVTAGVSAEADGADKAMMPEKLAEERARATATALA